MTVMAATTLSFPEGSIAPLKDGGIASVVIDMADTPVRQQDALRQDGRFINVDAQLPECASEFVESSTTTQRNSK